MEAEEISKIEILESGEILLVLASGGKPMYEYIYRESAEIYWDNKYKAFKSPPPSKWNHTDWYRHILTVTESGLGIPLKLSQKALRVNVPESIRAEICSN